MKEMQEAAGGAGGSERERFLERLAQQRAGGLVDLHYTFAPTRPMAPEEIFKAMNEVEEAIKRGRRHTDWNGNDAAAFED